VNLADASGRILSKPASMASAGGYAPRVFFHAPTFS